eukprot:NODE_373_length_8576_cov_0.988557.p5 type:complete len:240 gc:universal NODE_373_length_8576_cov_0.988557:3754-3035(-)
MSFRIGCVPERFFASIQHMTTICPGGTGQMLDLLNKREIDVAIGLTEGFVKSGKYPIIGQYMINPITWMICGNKPSTKQIKTLGISRVGSGSELMGHLLKNRDGIQFNFKVCQDINGLLDHLRKGEIDAFLWEYFTTLPLIDKSEIMGTIDSPWPSFYIACHPDIVQHKHDLLVMLNEMTRLNHLDLLKHKNKESYKMIQYPSDMSIFDNKALKDCCNTLKSLGIVDKDHQYLTVNLNE